MWQTAECTTWNSKATLANNRLAPLLSKQLSTPLRLLFIQTKLEQRHEHGRWDRTLHCLFFSFSTHSIENTQVRSCSFTFIQHYKHDRPYFKAVCRLHEASGTFLENVCSLMGLVHLSALPAANDKHSMTATTGPVLSAFPCSPQFAIHPTAHRRY